MDRTEPLKSKKRRSSILKMPNPMTTDETTTQQQEHTATATGTAVGGRRLSRRVSFAEKKTIQPFSQDANHLSPRSHAPIVVPALQDSISSNDTRPESKMSMTEVLVGGTAAHQRTTLHAESMSIVDDASLNATGAPYQSTTAMTTYGSDCMQMTSVADNKSHQITTYAIQSMEKTDCMDTETAHANDENTEQFMRFIGPSSTPKASQEHRAKAVAALELRTPVAASWFGLETESAEDDDNDVESEECSVNVRKLIRSGKTSFATTSQPSEENESGMDISSRCSMPDSVAEERPSSTMEVDMSDVTTNGTTDCATAIEAKETSLRQQSNVTDLTTRENMTGKFLEGLVGDASLENNTLSSQQPTKPDAVDDSLKGDATAKFLTDMGVAPAVANITYGSRQETANMGSKGNATANFLTNLGVESVSADATYSCRQTMSPASDNNNRSTSNASSVDDNMSLMEFTKVATNAHLSSPATSTVAPQSQLQDEQLFSVSVSREQQSSTACKKHLESPALVSKKKARLSSPQSTSDQSVNLPSVTTDQLRTIVSSSSPKIIVTGSTTVAMPNRTFVREENGKNEEGIEDDLERTVTDIRHRLDLMNASLRSNRNESQLISPPFIRPNREPSLLLEVKRDNNETVLTENSVQRVQDFSSLCLVENSSFGGLTSSRLHTTAANSSSLQQRTPKAQSFLQKSKNCISPGNLSTTFVASSPDTVTFTSRIPLQHDALNASVYDVGCSNFAANSQSFDIALAVPILNANKQLGETVEGIEASINQRLKAETDRRLKSAIVNNDFSKQPSHVQELWKAAKLRAEAHWTERRRMITNSFKISIETVTQALQATVSDNEKKRQLLEQLSDLRNELNKIEPRLVALRRLSENADGLKQLRNNEQELEKLWQTLEQTKLTIETLTQEKMRRVRRLVTLRSAIVDRELEQLKARRAVWKRNFAESD